MYNSYLIEIAKRLNDGCLDMDNPIVQAVKKMYIDIVESEIDMWKDYDVTDEAFIEYFEYDFPPGFIRRDIKRAKQIIYDLRDIANGESIRYDLSPINTYVMYHLIDHRNYYLEDDAYDSVEIPQEVIKYLQQKNICQESDEYQYIQSWYSDVGCMNEDFEDIYNGDYVSKAFAENIANIYLYDEAADSIRVTIDEFFDLLPNDLLEQVKKKYQTEMPSVQLLNKKENLNKPTVFISYAWENDNHKTWVKSFADSLVDKGINVILDQCDLVLGDRIPYFMEQSVSKADYVLVICTPTYKEKSDNRTSGVGYEGNIITGELLTSGNERKFIPIIRKGSFENAMPIFLNGKMGIDLSNEGSIKFSTQKNITQIGLQLVKKQRKVNYCIGKKKLTFLRRI